MEKLTLVQLNRTKIRDSYWDRYIDLVKSTIIPYQWNILNDKIPGAQTSHGLMNFKIAAKRETGEFYGVVFQDTDVAKWLEAVALSLASHADKDLENTADEVIDLIEAAQQPDGYINTYFTIKEPEKRWSNLEEGHELYTAGHLMEAAVAYYNATGKRKFLDCICKFADLICTVFSNENNKDGYPGHQEVEIGLVKLYEVTGNRTYLAQAKEFLERRGREPNYFLEEEKRPDYKRIFPEFENYLPLYSQSHKPVREQDTAEGHAVRAVYMYCAMADVAYEYQDKELLQVCENLWNDISYKKMYITGSIGSSGLLERFTTGYDLPNNRNYSETCASIGLALFGRRMAQITRDAKYMEVVERALYNTLLSGVAMDGQSFFYVNPLEVWPDNCMPRTSMEHVKPVRQKWFGVACCPPNIARTLASIGEYIYFYDKSSIWINLFISSETVVEIEGHPVHLSQKTAFPNDGKIEITIENEDEAEFELAIRIPEYVKEYGLILDGKAIYPEVQKGYAKVMISGKNPSLVYKFALVPRILRANPLVKEDVGKVAIMKGPVVYCLEEVDNGKNLPAIFLDPEQELQESYEENLLGGTTVIRTAGKKVMTDGWHSNELYKESDLTMESIPLMFVPYPYWGNRQTGEMLVWVKEFI
ncbi:glycoside hydrolase family 127 protein [Robinsoniella sp. KNHs210]|uniref:glycoside hydrolase family 127 protein n=1 Tax=Robinsoniella sp. KNHs210 TaxID=1469950 RepID=UPI0004804F6A|nr:beta-L-arabinofuranosidase domain-containing protein [Robinsoniella sp. KNHs210]